MNTSYIFIGALVAVVVLVPTIIISLRNGIVRGKNGYQRTWADVIAWQRKKNNVISQLESGIKNYSEFEASTQEKLTNLRMLIAQLSEKDISSEKLEKAQVATKEVMAGMKATFEAYANLKTSDLYLRWMRELSEIEDNVAAAITVFNASVQDFNDSIQVFPGNIVNGMFNNEIRVTPFNDSQAENGLEYKLAQR